MRTVLSSLLAVALIASVAGAGVSETQSFLSALCNNASLTACEISACSSNSQIIDLHQSAEGACCTEASEYITGVFTQVGNASGTCAQVGVLQEIGASGVQVQAIGNGTDPLTQQQTLNLSGGQAVTKTDGAGQGSALQTMILSEGQNGANVGGNVMQSAAVVGNQNTVVNGIPTAQGQAGSTQQIGIQQVQLVN